MKGSALILVAAILLIPSAAFGYVDPGSGYLFTQLILGMGAGALFFVTRGIRRMFRTFATRREK